MLWRLTIGQVLRTVGVGIVPAGITKAMETIFGSDWPLWVYVVVIGGGLAIAYAGHVIHKRHVTQQLCDATRSSDDPDPVKETDANLADHWDAVTTGLLERTRDTVRRLYGRLPDPVTVRVGISNHNYGPPIHVREVSLVLNTLHDDVVFPPIGGGQYYVIEVPVGYGITKWSGNSWFKCRRGWDPGDEHRWHTLEPTAGPAEAKAFRVMIGDPRGGHVAQPGETRTYLD